MRILTALACLLLMAASCDQTPRQYTDMCERHAAAHDMAACPEYLPPDQRSKLTMPNIDSAGGK